MALLFWEGFDSYGSISDIRTARPEIIPNWNTRFGWDPFFYTNYGRFGGGCIMGDGTVWGPGLIYLSSIGYNPTELYTGRALNFQGGYSDGDGCLQVFGNAFSSATGDVYVNSYGGVLNVYNFNGTLLGSSPGGTVKAGVWFWLEMRVKMSSSSSTADGIVELWVNNVKVMSNLACITKRSNSSTGYGGINLQCYYSDGSNPYGGNIQDDIYVVDTTGPAPWNTRLGDLRIATIPVTSDVGPNQGYPSVGGSTHYITVNDRIPSTANYISTSSMSSGYGEMFGHAGLPISNAAAILATAVTVYAGKTDAGNANFKISMASKGNTYNSNTFALSTSNAYFRQEWISNPATGSQWANTDWYASNVGFYIV